MQLLLKRALLLLGERCCACVGCFERALLLLELMRLLLQLLLGVRCGAQFTCFTGTQFTCFTSCVGCAASVN